MPNPLYWNPNGSLDSTITDLFVAYDSATIAAGAITMTTSAMQIDTQGSAASDNLDTITATNAEAGTVLLLRSTAGGRTVVLRHMRGNIVSPSGDLTLTDPQVLVMLVYSGSNWVVMNCCGGGAESVEITIGGGENAGCVIAQRIVLFVAGLIDRAGAARSGGLVSVALSLTDSLRLVNPSASASRINALALAIVTAYADSTALAAAFTSGVYDNLRCEVYCAHNAGSTTFSAAEVSEIIARLGAETGTPYDILEGVIAAMGADGLTRALGLATITATTEDCAPCNCTAVWCYTFDFAISDGGWAAVNNGGLFSPSTLGVYSGGAWRDSNMNSVGTAFNTRGVYIERSFTDTVVTRIEVIYDKTNGSFPFGARTMQAIGVVNGGGVFDTGLSGSESNGTNKLFTWTGSTTLDRIQLRNDSKYVEGSGSEGLVVFKSVTIYGTGTNPFGADNCAD